MAALKAWLRDEGLWLYAGSASDRLISHVFLDGGKAAVPHERMAEFFSEYARCVMAGDTPCAVERLSAMGEAGQFRMFMDIDLKDFEGDLFETAQQIIDALPDELNVGDIVVCNKPTSVDQNANQSTGHRKEGLHLVWDEVFVTSRRALHLVSITLSNLCALFPDALTEWAHALDGSVYRNSGLRMVFSKKGHREGDDSAYAPWFVSALDKSTSERNASFIQNPTADISNWLQRCSIIPAEAKTAADVVADRLNNTRTSNKNKRPRSSAPTSDGFEEAMLDVLQDTPYLGCTHSGPIKIGTTFVVRLNSKFCMNVGREHRGNGSYLIVTRERVRQACHCKCAETGCALRRTEIAGIRNPLSEHLFPKRPTASVLPTSQRDAVERWACAIKRQRNASS